MNQPPLNNPWYREFWAWFVLAPLIVVVIVSSITITIAVRYADDRVVDNYYKEGRMINMTLDQDLLAQSLNIHAKVTFARDIDEVSVILTLDNDKLPKTLWLQLSHPAQATLDHMLILSQVAGQHYQGALSTRISPSDLKHRWYLRLQPADVNPEQQWRLRGEINFIDTETVLLKANG